MIMSMSQNQSNQKIKHWIQMRFVHCIQIQHILTENVLLRLMLKLQQKKRKIKQMLQKKLNLQILIDGCEIMINVYFLM